MPFALVLGAGVPFGASRPHFFVLFAGLLLEVVRPVGTIRGGFVAQTDAHKRRQALGFRGLGGSSGIGPNPNGRGCVTAPYTVGEVLWLLQMTRQEAIDYDASPKDSCADLSEDPYGGGSANADPSLFVICRWHDVHDARKRVVRRKGDEFIIRLRAEGFTELEIVRLARVPQATMRRRFRATLAEIVTELGGDLTVLMPKAGNPKERRVVEAVTSMLRAA